MKLAFVAKLALFGAAMALPVAMNASAAAGAQSAPAHGGHGGQKEQGHHGHGHGGGAPSQEAIAAMAVSTSVVISDCWIRLLPAPAPSAGYFVAANQGDKPVSLTTAASQRYGDVMLHQTTHTDGMSRMSSVSAVEIAPGSKLEFKPGGYHIMLEKPTAEIKVGDAVPMQFLLASGVRVDANCQVKPANTLAK